MGEVTESDWEKAVEDCFGPIPEDVNKVRWFKHLVSELRGKLEWLVREKESLGLTLVDPADPNTISVECTWTDDGLGTRELIDVERVGESTEELPESMGCGTPEQPCSVCGEDTWVDLLAEKEEEPKESEKCEHGHVRKTRQHRKRDMYREEYAPVQR